MQITAIRTKQDGTTLYVGTVPAGELIKHSKPDIFRTDNGSEHGYQRAPERPRALQVARFLKGPQVLMPTAVVLGARSQLPYDEETGVLTIPDDLTLYEVDGQHRIAGFRAAINEQSLQRLEDFPVVTVVIDETSEEIEASQFRVINETAKKVRTDLARRILARIARLSPMPLRRQAILGRKWEVRATEVIEVIAADANSVWYGRIQAPNEKKGPRHTIKEQSFGDSLRPLLSSYPFEDYHADTIAEGLNQYWRAWQEIMADATDSHEYSDPFEEPQGYVLIKAAPGVIALHLVLRHLWSVFERRGVPLEAGRIAEALHRAGEVAKRYDPQDDFTTRRAWHGEDGTFGFYGGLKGAKGLADLIVEYLNEAGYALEMAEAPA